MLPMRKVPKRRRNAAGTEFASAISGPFRAAAPQCLARLERIGMVHVKPVATDVHEGKPRNPPGERKRIEAELREKDCPKQRPLGISASRITSFQKGVTFDRSSKLWWIRSVWRCSGIRPCLRTSTRAALAVPLDEDFGDF